MVSLIDLIVLGGSFGIGMQKHIKRLKILEGDLLSRVPLPAEPKVRISQVYVGVFCVFAVVRLWTGGIKVRLCFPPNNPI